jgi:hypothetical protein
MTGIIGTTPKKGLGKKIPCTWCKQRGVVNDPEHPGKTMICPVCHGKKVVPG